MDSVHCVGYLCLMPVGLEDDSRNLMDHSHSEGCLLVNMGLEDLRNLAKDACGKLCLV